MKRIKIKGIEEEIFYHKLDNGLDVYLYTKEGFHNNYVTFTTKFGSIYNEFIPINEDKMITVPKGVAHFLEHKVFIQKDGPQPSDFYAESGTLTNAYTTFKNTTYLFSGPDNLINNIKYLLDFVQKPYFTDENVESEKGIITQEIHMCDDRPIDVLYEHIRKNCLHKNPFKDSIIGTVKDINSITKEILNTCYYTFYNPSNMFLVVTGNFNKEEVLEEIIKNQEHKKISKMEKINIKTFKEPDSVVLKEETINMTTDVPKLAYTIKLSCNNFSIEKRKLNIYLYILFSILFDDSSKFNEIAKNNNIITNSVYVNILNCDTHILVSLLNETFKYKELINMIKEELKNIKISEKDLERKKRVLISNEIFSYENVEIVNEMIIDNIIFDNSVEENIVDIINSLNIEEMTEIIDNIDFNNVSTIILKSDKE